MMKIRVLFPLLLLLCAVAPVFAQTVNHSATDEPLPLAQHANAAQTRAIALSVKALNSQLEEAQALLKEHAASVAEASSEFVTLAALDKTDARIHLLSLQKELFLKRGTEIEAITSAGAPARVTIVRANGVNTAVQIFDTENNRQLVPLVVQYPILRDGELREMAYYTSAHPALLSPDVVREGGSYVRTMLDNAAERLRAQGVAIEPEIIDIAEHLCIVEHTDHSRFLKEERGALFNEILSLYALNAPNTYRYSVSSAGAGGMVQMIPSTYAMVRRLHPNADLKADFVSGMTDHSNALEAMLLYMQDTWNDLLRSADVRDALASGIATQPELVAAGYNSNPARLPSYIRRGGAGWRNLIPTETQMYLRIYASLDQLYFHNNPAPTKRAQPTGVTPLVATLLTVWQNAANAPSASVIDTLLPALGEGFMKGGGRLSSSAS
jgi:hypothetical protein